MTRMGSYQAVLAACVIASLIGLARAAPGPVQSEALAGFDNRTNGLVAKSEFDKARNAFAESETVEEGLGPVYNAQSCGACHLNPVMGGISQITEVRAGHLDGAGVFVPAPGGSLINDLAIDPTAQESVPDTEDVRTLRATLNTLGDGYVEAIDDDTLRKLAAEQASLTGGLIAGRVVEVSLLEAPGLMRVGRFGWKNQHASLLSFSADAYLNEMGITSRLAPTENTSLGASVRQYDLVPDPEDNPNKPEGKQDIDLFAEFMRATKAPPRDPARSASADALAGSALFDTIGCNVCHVRTLTTAPAGTLINGGTFAVPPALGDKIIHPLGDFLLHDIGTGDGIVQGPAAAHLLRTAPLWGVRTRSRLMHDGQSLTFGDAIQRHAGEAAVARQGYRALSAADKRRLFQFLGSL